MKKVAECNDSAHHSVQKEGGPVAYSLRGRRAENQDNYLLIKADGEIGSASYLHDQQPVTELVANWPADCVRLAVADGMGGHDDGREVAESLVKALVTVPPNLTEPALKGRMLSIHADLYQRYSGTPRRDDNRPGSTLVFADIDRRSGQCLLFSVGDSRAYQIRDGVWGQMTADHTQSEFEWRDGEIERSEYELRLRIPTNTLAQAVGYGSFAICKNAGGHKLRCFSHRLRIDLASELPGPVSDHADLKVVQLAPGDTLLLTSDGLWDTDGGVLPVIDPDASIASAAQLEALAQNSYQSGSNDNITLVVYQYRLNDGMTSDQTTGPLV